MLHYRALLFITMLAFYLSLAADGPWKLFGAGALVYTKEKHGLSSVQLPWCNGLSFRTKQANATLMTINLGAKLQDSLTGQIVIEVHTLKTDHYLRLSNVEVICKSSYNKMCPF